MATRTKKKRIGSSGAANVTTNKIKNYISEFLEEYDLCGADLLIKEICVPPVQSPNKNNEKMWREFQKCFSSKETLHHGYLKWFSYNYIKDNASNLMDIEISLETNVYMPNLKYWEDSELNVYGRFLRTSEFSGIGISSSPEYGQSVWIQEADVTCQSAFIVECGDTSPMSLVMPIITQAANKVIWIPHKAQNKYRKVEWDDFETPLKAFIISNGC